MEHGQSCIGVASRSIGQLRNDSLNIHNKLLIHKLQQNKTVRVVHQPKNPLFASNIILQTNRPKITVHDVRHITTWPNIQIIPIQFLVQNVRWPAIMEWIIGSTIDYVEDEESADF